MVAVERSSEGGEGSFWSHSYDGACQLRYGEVGHSGRTQRDERVAFGVKRLLLLRGATGHGVVHVLLFGELHLSCWSVDRSA